MTKSARNEGEGAQISFQTTDRAGSGCKKFFAKPILMKIKFGTKLWSRLAHSIGKRFVHPLRMK